MFKAVWFTRFREGMDKAEARRYWASHHAQIGARTAIERYVQNHVTGPMPTVSGVPGGETQFDGYSCGWWSSREAFDETHASPAWQALVSDNPNVFDADWLEGMKAEIEEQTIIDGPMSPFKVVWVVRFSEGMHRAEADRYWLETHGPIFQSLDIDRYVQNHVVGPLHEGGSFGFDGFSECWFRDREHFLKAVSSPTWAVAAEDAFNVFDTTQTWRAVVAERVVKAEPQPVAV